MTAKVEEPLYSEVPIFVEARDGTLLAIATLPIARRARLGLLILPGGGTPFTVNRNRLSVRLCRRLATLGYAGFRSDYHGTGDSTGRIERIRMDRPFTNDVSAALARFKEMGVERFVLAGSCFGARTALAAAAEREDVDAVILISATPRDYPEHERRGIYVAETVGVHRYLREAMRPSRWRGILDARTRRRYARYTRAKLRAMRSRAYRRWKSSASRATPVSGGFEGSLRAILEHGVEALFIYGSEDDEYAEYREVANGPLADVLGVRSNVRVMTVPGKANGYTTVQVQDAVLDAITAYMEARSEEGLLPAQGVR